jgi:5-methylcytosine-specific restriction endonuclease McrA
VLQAESLIAVAYSNGCTVATGKWVDAYTGAVFTAASALDIDHVVPLENAWQSGASTWTPAQRLAYANNLDQPEALVAVSASANRSKGDRSPDEWTPPNHADWCT